MGRIRLYPSRGIIEERVNNMKKIVLLLGPPYSGKSKLSIKIANILDGEVVSWAEVVHSAGGSTDDMPDKIYNKAQKMFKAAMLSAKSETVILTGYALHVNEAEEICQWAKNGEIEIIAIARINITLEALLERNKTISHLKAINNYYLWRHNTKDIDKIFTAEAHSQFELDGDASVDEMLVDFLSGLSTQLKPSTIYVKEASTSLKTSYGEFILNVYQSKIDFSYHLALIKGDVRGQKGVLARVHSSCITGDILYSKHCDCGEQLRLALELIGKEKKGVLFYLFQEGRGINIINKIKAYDLQNRGLDTVEANLALGLPSEMREYEIIRDIVNDLGIESIKLLTNNPEKGRKLRKLGVSIDEMVKHEVPYNDINKRYLKIKQVKMHHRIDII
jgi:GTP cyclohydrolase II